MIQNEFIFSPLLLQQCFLGWLKKKCFVWQDVHFQNVILAAILLPHLAKALCMASSIPYTRQSTRSEHTIFLSSIISLVAGIEYVPPSKHLLNVLGMLQGMDCVHHVSSWQVHSA